MIYYWLSIRSPGAQMDPSPDDRAPVTEPAGGIESPPPGHHHTAVSNSGPMQQGIPENHVDAVADTGDGGMKDQRNDQTNVANPATSSKSSSGFPVVPRAPHTPSMPNSSDTKTHPSTDTHHTPASTNRPPTNSTSRKLPYEVIDLVEEDEAIPQEKGTGPNRDPHDEEYGEEDEKEDDNS